MMALSTQVRAAMRRACPRWAYQLLLACFVCHGVAGQGQEVASPVSLPTAVTAAAEPPAAPAASQSDVTSPVAEAANAPAASGVGQAAPPSFSSEIQPILAKRCYACHGPDEGEGGLRFSDKNTVYKELDSGVTPIVPGSPEASELLKRVSSTDEAERMPPEGDPLSAEQVELLRRWIQSGAEWKEHWAFVPKVPQTPPEKLSKPDWVKNPIDAFILAQLDQVGLPPNPAADKATLIRRLYYDLIGLPPTPEEVQAFEQDSDPLAYVKLVDRLLASERYGEHWARHWLDLVRYADTNSYERDGEKPNSWKYRDYVIRSLNRDKPFDRFVEEQLAGDELWPGNQEALIATGYYRLGRWDDEPADKLQAEYDEWDDIVTVTGQVFLGLTVNCARCHDHKIDPIPQADYYRMLACFRDLGGHGDGIRKSDEFCQADVSPPEQAALHVAFDSYLGKLNGRLREIEQAAIVKMSAEDQRKTEGHDRDAVLALKLQPLLNADEQLEYAQLTATKKQLEQSMAALPSRERVLGVAKKVSLVPTHIMQRGNPHVPGDAVQPGVPGLFRQAKFEYPPTSSGPQDPSMAHSRTAFAKFITDPNNLLTSRVLANRIWQFHLGRGIVRSSNNFGQLGTPPTHPPLLDWLADQLVQSGWQLKPLHRLIVTSQTYQMSSAGRPDGLLKDPLNNHYWRFDMRRLSAEEVRDSIQMASGKLNFKMYGRGYFPKISAEVLAGQSVPGQGWGESSEEDRGRRSVYIYVKRSLITPILQDFDFPESDGSCEARFITTQPAQAFGLLNSEFIHEQAAAFAARLETERPQDERAQVERALALLYSQPATAEDAERCVRLIQTFKEKHHSDQNTAMKWFCLTAFNLNRFVYLD